MSKKAIEKKNTAVAEDNAEYYELIAKRKKLAKRIKALTDAGKPVPTKLRQTAAELKRQTNKGSVVLGKGFTTPAAKKTDGKEVKVVDITETTTIGELAKSLGMRPSGLVSRLFRHGTTAVGNDKVAGIKNIVKVLNEIGKAEGFKVQLIESTATDKLIGAFDGATRTRRVRKKPLTKIAISPRITIEALAEKLGITTNALIKHYFAEKKIVSTTQTVASAGRTLARKIAHDLNFELTYTKVGKVSKTVSQSEAGLTLRQLENEIFKVDRLRIVFRNDQDVRSGIAKWGKRMPDNATISSLIARLKRHHADFKDCQFVITDKHGDAYTSTSNRKQKLSSLAF